MKLVTLPRLIVLASVLAAIGVGISLDRQVEPNLPAGESPVVIDEAFLHRFQTDDERTTRDPVIKVLSRTAKGRETALDDLRAGGMTVRVRGSRDGFVVVKVTERSRTTDGVFTRVLKLSRHRPKPREWFSLKWWNEEFLHRPYWD